jgi:sulfur carrier protein
MRVNGEERVLEPMAVHELLEELSIDPRGIAVALNGEIVRRSEWSRTIVRDSDSVEIVTAAAGG